MENGTVFCVLEGEGAGISCVNRERLESCNCEGESRTTTIVYTYHAA